MVLTANVLGILVKGKGGVKYETIWCVCLSGQGHDRWQPSDRRESKVAHIYDAPPPTKRMKEKRHPTNAKARVNVGERECRKGSVSHSVAFQGRSTRDMRQRDKVALPSLCAAAAVVRACGPVVLSGEVLTRGTRAAD